MTLNVAEPSLAPARVSPFRRWTMIALVFAGQLGVIFWLGHKGSAPLSTSPGTLSLRLLDGVPSTNLALMDPSLFALPHRESFSGPAWMISAPRVFPAYAWSEPTRWLTNDITRLGASFPQAMAPGVFSLVDSIARAQPAQRLANLGPAESFAGQSTYQLTGDLANRHLLTPLDLRSWNSTELLTNSVVHLLVDARGRPISVALLPPGSGSKDADQEALAIASRLRFEPLPAPPPGILPDPLTSLRWGDLLLQWQTLPMAETNAPAGAKSP